jgi:iron complex outermembrane recepter protein
VAISVGRRFSRFYGWTFAVTCLLVGGPASVHAQTASSADAAAGQPSAIPGGTKDILNLDIEQLSKVEVHTGSASMATEVTTVTRTAEPIGQTPAAVYVVTNEMIRRCGARNIPEVLRTVPGVEVSRINASAWAISIRGFEGRFANKLLVQIDGVAIYNMAQGGVYWEREYVMLEDVERIEVVRGPGSTVWGLNAVNGVINIITKSSKDTKGVYADAGGGDQHREFGDFRVGGQSGNLHWRAYGMGMADATGAIPLPNIAADNPNMEQGGFRTDWTPTTADTITFQGDFYGGVDNRAAVYAPLAPRTPVNCATTTFMTRWARQVEEDTDWAIELYYRNPYALGPNLDTVETFDLDFQYHFKRDRHDVVWGCGYRNNEEEWKIVNTTIGIRMSEQIPSYFVQDTITLVDDRLFATFGSKFDHSSINGFDYQPTGRVVWTPDERTSIWGAVTRSVCTSSLVERFFSIIPQPENCLSYETGVRRQSTDQFFWELATFFNRYENLIGYDSVRVAYNIGRGDTYGFEYNATYNVTPQWRLTGSYSFLVEMLQYEPGYTPYLIQGGSARNRTYFQSGWDLSENVTLDVMLRYVDSLAAGVDAYVAGDIRLAWRPRRNLELSVVGQNLLAGKHYEFVYDTCAPTEIEPGVYGMVSWRY